MRHWDAYEAFVAVVDRGSYTAAADRLGISKSAVSRFVSDLEERLGSQLLYRTTRKLTPTDLGRLLYERCVTAFENLETIELEAMDHDAIPRGRMRIVASDWFGDALVAPLVAELTKQYDELVLELLVSDRIVDLVGEGYDLAIRYSAQVDSTLRAQKICELPHICAASPEYLVRAGTPTAPEDLVEHDCVISSFEPCSHWQFLPGPVQRQVNLHSKLTMNSGPSLISAALRGAGIIWLPKLYLGEYLRDGRLVEVLPATRADPMPVWGVYPARLQTSAKVNVFIDCLKKRMVEVNASA